MSFSAIMMTISIGLVVGASPAFGSDPGEGCGGCWDIGIEGINFHMVDNTTCIWNLPWYDYPHAEPLLGGCGSELMLEYHDYCIVEH